MLKLLFSEAKGQVDYVGYNHAVSLLNRAIGDRLVTSKDDGPVARMYCNLPWHHDAKGLCQGLPLVYYTMFETTRLPKGWVRFLNTNVDAIIVPSEWNEVVFRLSGVKVPIFVVHLGYDPTVFSRVQKRKMEGLYVFMWQGVAHDRGGRKGYDLAVDAFKELQEEGRLGDDARLIVKTKPMKDGDFNLGVDTGHGIIYHHGVMEWKDVIGLYEMTDCCLNPTHGEGFGLIPLEQMAMGKPVIVPDWSMPYLQEGCFVPVDYELKRSQIAWTHRSLHISLNGMALNFGGLSREIFFMPKHPIQLRSCSREPVKIPGLPSVVKRKMGRRHVAVNKAVNALSNMQRRLGLFVDKRRKRRQFVFEDPGKDAWVSKESLKKQMLWCYHNRTEAKRIGDKAHTYARSCWTMERIKNEFEAIEPELEAIIKRKAK